MAHSSLVWYRSAACYYRAGLRIGVVAAAEAIAWADSVIEQRAAPPTELFDVSLAPPDDAQALIDALRPIAEDPIPAPVLRALLDRLRGDLFSGRIVLDEPLARLHRLSHALEVPEPLRWEILALDEDYSLVSDGIAGDLPTIHGVVRTFFAQFDGAYDALFRGAA